MPQSKKEITKIRLFPENLFGIFKAKSEDKLYEVKEIKIFDRLELSKKISDEILFNVNEKNIIALNDIFIKYKEMFKESEENLKIDVNLHGLKYTEAEGLRLPEEVMGNISLGGITSAKNVTFPKKVGGDISLISLTSIEDLVLPEEVGGEIIFLDEISYVEKEELQKKHPHIKFSF